jgi:hypothetical protein
VGIIIREVDLSRELDRYIATFEANFGVRDTRARFRWLYLDNPDGRATAWFAEDEATGEIAGCTAAFPRRIALRNGETVKAWNCGDFSITPRFRTMGVAIKLRRAGREAVDAGTAPFLYAHPNDRMLQVHLKVGHQPLGRMLRFAKPLRIRTTSRLGDRIGALALRMTGTDALVLRRAEIAPMSEPWGEELTELFDAAAPRVGTAVVRDTAYLEWRFRRHPLEQHQMIVSRAGGRITGYVIFSVEDDVALVKDWLARDDTAWRQLFAGFLQHARQGCLRSVSLTVLESHPDIGRLRRFGFMLRPEVSTAVVYAPAAFRGGNVLDRSAWYMTVGDRDI